MVITDSPTVGTGFAEEMRNLAYRLVQTGQFEIIWLGLQHMGVPVDLPDTVFSDLPHKGATIKIVGTRGNPKLYGSYQFPIHYETYTPDAVMFMGDPDNLAPYIPAKRRMRFPLYFYCTLDGLPIKNSWLKYLKYVNLMIAMTRWAQVEFAKVGLMPAQIHHGINWNWWSTNPKEKEDIRAKYGIDKKTVVYINWEANQHRKRQDALFRCWTKFQPEGKNAVLIPFSDWDCPMGWDFEDLIEETKAPRGTILSPKQLIGRHKFYECAESLELVREIAILGDIYVSTTSGEGSGKCSLEALSLGFPVIITDYSACPEVCAKGSILVPIKGTFRMPDTARSVNMGLVDEDKFVDAMVRLYQDEEERKKLGLIGRAWSQYFDYDMHIIPKWQKLLNSINPESILLGELLKVVPEKREED